MVKTSFKAQNSGKTGIPEQNTQLQLTHNFIEKLRSFSFLASQAEFIKFTQIDN
jgi:hypothetical protein